MFLHHVTHHGSFEAELCRACAHATTAVSYRQGRRLERLDPERPLSAAGRREVEAVARLLAGAGVRVAHVVHSGKLRAQQTAELLATALAPGTVPQVMRGLSPNDLVEPMVRRIADWTSDVMLVGHLPSMGKLVARLVAGDEGKPVAAFVPGTVVCLQQAEAGDWVIAWMVRPELAPLPV